MRNRIAEAWREIEATLGVDDTKRLRPPANARALAALERALGEPVPRDLVASLAIHDGARDRAPLWSNECLLGAASIARRARMMRGLVERDVISADHWSLTWIPLTDADGDGFCLAGERVIYFRNSGGGGNVVARSYSDWLASIPRRIRVENREDRRRGEQLADPATTSLPKRVRERLARIDQELPFLVTFVEDWPRHSTVRATRDRILTFRPIARLPAAEVLARAIDRRFVVEKRGLITVTAAGRKLRP